MSRATTTRSVPAKRGESDAEGMRDLAVELVGHRASDVVRLDDFIQN